MLGEVVFDNASFHTNISVPMIAIKIGAALFERGSQHAKMNMLHLFY